MLKNWWNNITLIGISENLSLDMQRQIVLTNQLAIVGGITMLVVAIIDFLIAQQFLGIFIAICALTQLLPLLFNKFKQHNTASFFLMITVNLIIFCVSSFCGFDAGVYLYYFPFIVGSALLFELNGNRIQFSIHFSLVILFLFILNFTKGQLFFNASLNKEAVQLMFINNSIASIFLIGYFVYLINKSNQEVKQKLQHIIEQKDKAERILKSSLSDKETLLAEVHHRVKNNLSVVTSLLNLKMDSVTNTHTKQVLLDCRNRVMSMSLIHEKLYRSKNFSDLNFKFYVDELINEIKTSYPLLDKDIKINVVSEDILLDLSTAIPCGLILNELITNSYKHAFVNKKSGEINILVSTNNNQVEIIVSDNGIGFNAVADDSNSLGLILVESLIEQLEGKAAFIFDDGTKFILTFKVKE